MGMNVILHKHNPSDTKNGHSAIVQELLSSGQSRNRNIPAAATTWANSTNTVTWPTGFGVSEITVTSQSSDLLIVYDAPNDATASAWLSDSGALTSDIAYDYIPAATLFTKQFSNTITRLDVLPLTGITRIVIGAV